MKEVVGRAARLRLPMGVPSSEATQTLGGARFLGFGFLVFDELMAEEQCKISMSTLLCHIIRLLWIGESIENSNMVDSLTVRNEAVTAEQPSSRVATLISFAGRAWNGTSEGSRLRR